MSKFQFQLLTCIIIKIKQYTHDMNIFFRKKPSNVDNSKNLIQEYYSIKQKIELPLKIKLFLDMLENYAEEGNQKKKIPKEISDIYKHLCQCFTKLKFQQKYYFMLAMLKTAQFLLHENQKKNESIIPLEQCRVQKIETTCQIRQFFMGVSKWESRIFKFFNIQKLVKIGQNKNNKKQIVLQLTQYHLRASTRQKNTLVFECIFQDSKVIQKHECIYIRFKDKTLFSQIYCNLRNSIISTWKHRLAGMLNSTEKNENNGQKLMDDPNQNRVRMLNSKTVAQYFQTKQKINNTILTGQIKFKIFSQTRKIKIYRASKYLNLYKTQNIVDFSFQQVIQNTQLINGIPNKKLLHYQKMQNFSNNISAVYYKYMVKGCTHEMLSIVEQVRKPNELRVTFKAIDNFTIHKNVDFIQLKVVKVMENKTKIGAYGFVNFDQNKKLNPISVIDFFLSIVQYQGGSSEKKKIQNQSPVKLDNTISYDSAKINFSNQNPFENGQMDEDQFRTVVGQNFSSDQQRQLQILNTFECEQKQQKQLQDEEMQKIQTSIQRQVFMECKNQKGEGQIDQNKKQQSTTVNQQQSINQFQYLKHKFIFQPAQSKEGRDLIPQHYFTGQWAKYQKGGVYSLNKKAFEKQMQVYKSTLTRLGVSLMKKKTPSFSIPAIVLRPQSQLQSIARNVSYAPILLQNLQNSPALQKMKKCILLMISMGNLGLSLAKPFNPIIGQTFQAYINNCPIYMEQIQHHPAISSLLLKGRGYEVFGNVIPAISISLNSVKCYSQDLITVKFDTGDIIQFAPSKMNIGGLLVGIRTFDFIETTYLFDKKNLLIAEITFGHKKKFGLHLKGDKNDFLWGYIYQVSQAFMTKFVGEGAKHSPSGDKNAKIVCQVYGCWNQKIYMDQNVVFDFQNQLPCKLVRQKYVLRSNCTLRDDIRFLAQQKIDQAQDQKDRLEDLQRHDARLRKKNK